MGVLKKTLSSDRSVVISVIDTTDIVRESMNRIQSFPPATVHLGQAMMGAALIQSLWNDKGKIEKVGLQWRAEGPFGHVYAESKQDGKVRGTINSPQAPIDNYNTPLGPGHLQVQRHMTAETPSTGIIEATGVIPTDLSDYLTLSEQRHATLSMSVKIDWNQQESKDNSPFDVVYALGFLVDVLPHSDQDQTHQKLLQWHQYLESLGPISEWALNSSNRLSGMLHLLHPGEDLKELMYQKIYFHCDCSQKRADRAAKLSEKLAPDLETEDNGALQVQCEFCGKNYEVET